MVSAATTYTESTQTSHQPHSEQSSTSEGSSNTRVSQIHVESNPPTSQTSRLMQKLALYKDHYIKDANRGLKRTGQMASNLYETVALPPGGYTMIASTLCGGILGIATAITARTVACALGAPLALLHSVTQIPTGRFIDVFFEDMRTVAETSKNTGTLCGSIVLITATLIPSYAIIAAISAAVIAPAVAIRGTSSLVAPIFTSAFKTMRSEAE